MNNFDYVMEDILNNSNDFQIQNEINYDIMRYKNGEDVEWIRGKKDDRYLKDLLDIYQKEFKEYNNFSNLLRNRKNNYDIHAENEALYSTYIGVIKSSDFLKRTSIYNKMQTDLQKEEHELNKAIQNLGKTIKDNKRVVVKFEKNRIYNKKLGQTLEENGYNVINIEKEIMKQKYENKDYYLEKTGIDYEKLNEIRQIQNSIESNKIRKRNENSKIIDIQIIQPLSVGNLDSEEIFNDVYERLNKIQVMRNENNLLGMSQQHYDYIVNELIEIIYLYQQIQLLQTTKDAFKNTIANKYDESINTLINNIHKEIEKRYNSLNKYINKIDKENILGPSVEKKVNQQNSIQKNDMIENKESKIEKEDTTILDNYKKQISSIEQNKELMSKRGIFQGKYMQFRDMKMGQANIPFVEFLKLYYPNEIELIKEEKIREKQVQHVYQLWQKSGKYMDFGTYAEQIQGVKISHPEDYVKENDIENTYSYNNDAVNYVDAKKSSIEKAKERYNKKSALWKLFHKKMNPEKQNFDTMTNEEIENLYTGRSR